LDGLALVSAAGAVWCLGALIFDDIKLFWLGLSIVPALVAWGMWFRRTWGHLLAALICCLLVVFPPIVMLWVHIDGQGKDSIGHGIIFIFALLALLFVSPSAILLLWPPR
jgi:hypothetical protein